MNLLINIVRVLTVIFYLVAGFASFIEPIAMYAGRAFWGTRYPWPITNAFVITFNH